MGGNGRSVPSQLGTLRFRPLRYTEISCSRPPITTMLTIIRWRESAGYTLDVIVESKFIKARR